MTAEANGLKRPVPDPVVIRRQNELADLYYQWPGDGEPADDPEFVAAARDVMGLPPSDDDEEPDDDEPDEDEPDDDESEVVYYTPPRD